jgi:hypothetical protein
MSLHDKPRYGYILTVYQTQLLQLSIRGYNEESPQMGLRTTNETKENWLFCSSNSCSSAGDANITT